MILPTVMVRHPLDHNVCMVINASDYDEAVHEMWVDPVPTASDLKVARGARGLWFVKRDGEAVSAGFKDQAGAEAAMEALA